MNRLIYCTNYNYIHKQAHFKINKINLTILIKKTHTQNVVDSFIFEECYCLEDVIIHSIEYVSVQNMKICIIGMAFLSFLGTLSMNKVKTKILPCNQPRMNSTIGSSMEVNISYVKWILYNILLLY